MMKKILSLALALVMCMGLAAPTLAAYTEPALTAAEMTALLPSERPEMTPPESLSLPFDEYDEEDEAATFREIAELTQSLTAGKTTETEKARAIFDWVSQNIEYDYTAYGYITAQTRGERLTEEQEIRASQAENPGCTFLDRRGVCGGYSALTILMHGLAGLPTGYISCKLNNQPHQGNAVYADGRWILLDSTNKWWDMSADQYPITESITWWDGIFRMRIYSTGQVSCFVQNRYKDISSVTIPSSVNTLDDSAFANCTELTSVTIPSNVIYLKNGVFKGCTALTSVDIPNSVTDMGTWTFWDCTSLAELTIPNSVTKIGQYTFNGCTALAHLDIPDSVTEIETDAFKNCTALTELTIPGSMTKLAGHTFEGCTALTDVTFLDGLTDIEAGMFWGCSSLKRVAIPASVTSIGQAAFYNCPNVTDVYYGGSEEQWNAINIAMFNSPMARGSTTRATFHYGSAELPVDPNDIPSSWAQEQVNDAIQADLIPRDLQRAYRNNITREEFCRLMVILVERKTGMTASEYAQSKGKSITDPFADTDSADILAAYALGIVKGNSDTTFNPEGSITRQEAALMLARTAGVLEIASGEGQSFGDAANIASWAKEGVGVVSGLTDPVTGSAVMGGTGNGCFSPLDPYTREQAYLTVLRLFRCGE